MGMQFALPPKKGYPFRCRTRTWSDGGPHPLKVPKIVGPFWRESQRDHAVWGFTTEEDRGAFISWYHREGKHALKGWLR